MLQRGPPWPHSSSWRPRSRWGAVGAMGHALCTWQEVARAAGLFLSPPAAFVTFPLRGPRSSGSGAAAEHLTVTKLSLSGDTGMGNTSAVWVAGGCNVGPHSHRRDPDPGPRCSASPQMGFHLCLVGWMDNGTAGYPTAFPTPSCGSNHVGIVDYGPRNNLSETWDAFCYREKGERRGHGAAPGRCREGRTGQGGGAWAAGGGSGALRGASRRSLADVTCVCPDGFVGDGTWCRGRLPDVLAEDARFSTFYSVSDAPGAGPWRGRPGLPAVLMGSFPAAARFCQRLGRRAGVFHLFVRRLRSQNAFCPREFWLRGERGTRPRGGRGSRGAAGLRAAPAPSSPARSPQTLSGEELQLHASALLLFSFDLTAGTAVPSRAGRDLRVSALPPGNGSARSVGPTSARSPPPLPPAPRVRNARRPLPLCSPAAGNHGDRRLRRRGVGHRGRQRRHPRPRRAAAAAPARGAARAGE